MANVHILHEHQQLSVTLLDRDANTLACSGSHFGTAGAASRPRDSSMDKVTSQCNRSTTSFASSAPGMDRCCTVLLFEPSSRHQIKGINIRRRAVYVSYKYVSA